MLVISKNNRVTLPYGRNIAMMSTAVSKSKVGELTKRTINKNKHFKNSQGMTSFRHWLVIEGHGAGTLLGDDD